MAIDEAHFRLAMAQFASGVTVVTCRDQGNPLGMTVASFCSLSLRPPLVLVCIEKTAKTHDPILSAGSFGVNVLRSDQEDLSRRFSSRTPDRFVDIALRGELGPPLFEQALVAIVCELRDHFPGGDHSIFVGEVVDAFWTEGEPLLYYRSGYRALA